MVGRLIALIALCTDLTAAPSLGAQSAPALQFPLALECTLLAIAHAKKLPETGRHRTIKHNRTDVFTRSRTYARTNCPASGKTIWAQIEAVADTGFSDDEMALRAACR